MKFGDGLFIGFMIACFIGLIVTIVLSNCVWPNVKATYIEGEDIIYIDIHRISNKRLNQTDFILRLDDCLTEYKLLITPISKEE